MAIGVSNAWTDAENKVREKLRHYRSMVANYQACKELYDTLFPSCTNQLTGMPRAEPDGYEPERWADKRLTQSARMARSLAEMQNEYMAIEDMIKELDGFESAIIKRHFFMNETYNEIAESTKKNKIPYAKAQIVRICYKAIRKMTQKMITNDNK